MSSLAVLLGTLCLTLVEDEPAATVVDLAFDRFLAAEAELQASILHEIEQRIETHANGELGALRQLTERARAELEVLAARPATFFDPVEYASGRVTRSWVDPESKKAARAREEHPHFVRPAFHVAVRYDDAANQARTAAPPLDAEQRLANLLAGYPPDADVLTAWLEQQFDRHDEHDAIAFHFQHAYCELSGNCYADVTLFDAFCSATKHDMPDVDVIAFARLVLRSRSYRSPIPPGSRRTKLYQRITKEFAEYYRERTLGEALADLYLNPEAPLRPEHENLRQRVLYAFYLAEHDVEEVRKTLRRAKDRDGFVRRMDAKIRRDRDFERELQKMVARYTEARWVVAETAHAVLREYRLLQD